MGRASTRPRSDVKERCNPCFFAFICFPHAKSIGEIQSSFQQSLVSLGHNEGDSHPGYGEYKNTAQSGGNNFAGLAVLAIDASAFRSIQLTHQWLARLSLPLSNLNRSF
jgi:hypothetical protein